MEDSWASNAVNSDHISFRTTFIFGFCRHSYAVFFGKASQFFTHSLSLLFRFLFSLLILQYTLYLSTHSRISDSVILLRIILAPRNRRNPNRPIIRRFSIRSFVYTAGDFQLFFTSCSNDVQVHPKSTIRDRRNYPEVVLDSARCRLITAFTQPELTRRSEGTSGGV